MPSYEEARACLRKHLGYEDFRPGQRAVIRSILSGRDTLALMPTGGGKSLCFQIPAMVFDGASVVISPLISLMKDQVDNACRVGIPATFVNSTLTPQESRGRMEGVRSGRFKLLYFAPERAENPRFVDELKQIGIAMLAVDEAHCLSQWGYEFRPSYLKLGALREALRCRIIALTATATPEVRSDIVKHLRLKRPKILASGFDRANLKWHVLAAETPAAKDALLLQLLERQRSGPALVFASTRKRVDALADYLNARSIKASGYHAGVKSEERTRLQERFMKEEAGVMIATNAFGMGIDKPNVRLVVHYDMPGSLEGYYQEAGRAGRDGADSDCLLLHAYRDRFTHEFMIDGAHPDEHTVRRILKLLPDSFGHADIPSIIKSARTNRRELGSALRILGKIGAVELPPKGTDCEVHVQRRALRTEEFGDSNFARERELVRLKRMQAYAYHKGCRRTFVMEYFGSRFSSRQCAGCDNCAGKSYLPSATRPVSRFRTSPLWQLLRPIRRYVS